MLKGNKPLTKETQNTKPKEIYSCLFHTPRVLEQNSRGGGKAALVPPQLCSSTSPRLCHFMEQHRPSPPSPGTNTHETQELCSPELNHSTFLLWTKSNSPKIAHFPTACATCPAVTQPSHPPHGNEWEQVHQPEKGATPPRSCAPVNQVGHSTGVIPGFLSQPYQGIQNHR